MSHVTFDLVIPKSNQVVGSARYIHDPSLAGIHQSVLEITRSRERDVQTKTKCPRLLCNGGIKKGERGWRERKKEGERVLRAIYTVFQTRQKNAKPEPDRDVTKGNYALPAEMPSPKHSKTKCDLLACFGVFGKYKRSQL